MKYYELYFMKYDTFDYVLEVCETIYFKATSIDDLDSYLDEYMEEHGYESYEINKVGLEYILKYSDYDNETEIPNYDDEDII